MQRNQNALPRGPSQNRDTPREPIGREKSRPAPASLQQIVDSTPLDSIRSSSRPSRPESRPSQSRPSQSRPSQSRPSQFRPREEEVEAPAAPNSNRLQQIRIETAPETTQRPTSPRLQVRSRFYLLLKTKLMAHFSGADRPSQPAHHLPQETSTDHHREADHPPEAADH